VTSTPNRENASTISIGRCRKNEDGRALIPSDFRLYNAPIDGLAENDRFRAMLTRAREGGFRSNYVVFDSWYSGMENLKLVAGFGWHFFTRLKENRPVDCSRREEGERSTQQRGDTS
jgi:hypothetical protein